MTPDQLAQLRVAAADGADQAVFVDGDRLWCIEAEIPIAAQRGRLLAGRRRRWIRRPIACSFAPPRT